MEANARKLFVTLPAWDFDQELIGISAEIAALMRAELEALLIEEEALPLEREFRPSMNEWQQVDRARMQAESLAIGRRAERLVEAAARAANIIGRFEIAKGNPTTLLADRIRQHDIVAIAPPHPSHSGIILAEAHPFVHRAAATLLLPRRLARRRGAIAALIREPSDPALAVAAEIAFLSSSGLIALTGFIGEAREAIAEQARAAGLTRERIRIVERPKLDTQSVLAALEYAGERLLVTSLREPELETHLAEIVSVRRIPLLLIRPESPGRKEAGRATEAQALNDAGET